MTKGGIGAADVRLCFGLGPTKEVAVGTSCKFVSSSESRMMPPWFSSVLFVFSPFWAVVDTTGFGATFCVDFASVLGAGLGSPFCSGTFARVEGGGFCRVQTSRQYGS